MKKLLCFSLLSFVILVTACNDDNGAWEPKNPLLTTSLMKQYANEDNYEQFKTLFQEGHDENSIKQMYETVKQATSDSAGIDTFTLVSFDNEKTLLVHLTPKSTDEDEVLIQNVSEVPEEMAAYLQEVLKQK